jgi:polar amino acid transport system substrate-binding protein
MPRLLNRLIFLLLSFLAVSCGDNVQGKVVWIARDPSWYPLNMMGKGDNLLGFTDELLYSIAQEEGIHVELVMTSAAGIFTGLEEGKYTGVISFLIPDSMNQQAYSFSEIYYPMGPVLVVEKSSTIKSLADLKGKILGIQTGSSFAFDIASYPDISVTPYENILFALENLSKGQIDGVIMDSIAADVYTSSYYKGKLEIASPILTPGGMRLLVLKGDGGQDLLALFNEGLHKMKDSGKYEALVEKWSLFDSDFYKKK